MTNPLSFPLEPVGLVKGDLTNSEYEFPLGQTKYKIHVRRESYIGVFIAEVLPLLRLKSGNGATGSSTAEVFQEGDLVMVCAESTNKDVLPWKTASVFRRLSGRRYEVRW